MPRQLALLRRAKTIAEEKKLTVLESTIHLPLANLLKANREKPGEVRDILERDREICLQLLREAILALDRCSTLKANATEFTRLSPLTRSRFYTHLLEDLNTILEKLESNSRDLTAVMRTTEDYHRSLSVLDAVTAYGRAVSHKAKNAVIYGADPRHLVGMGLTLRRSADLIRTLKQPGNYLNVDLVDRVYDDLTNIAESLSGVGSSLSDLLSVLDQDMQPSRDKRVGFAKRMHSIGH